MNSNALPMLIMLAAAAGLVVSFAMRRSPWAALIWVPTAAVTWWSSARLLAVVGAHQGPGMEALGGMFALLFGWPWLVLALACFFAIPRNWRPLPTMLGVAAAAGSIFGLTYGPTTERTVQVFARWHSRGTRGLICDNRAGSRKERPPVQGDGCRRSAHGAL